MSKAALDHFTKTMATNLMTEGVRVNSINPATVRTDIHYQKGIIFCYIILSQLNSQINCIWKKPI